MSIEDDRLEEDKTDPLCYSAGNLQPCKNCYRNPENRKPASLGQEYLCGSVEYLVKNAKYVCEHFAEMPLEILVELE